MRGENKKLVSMKTTVERFAYYIGKCQVFSIEIIIIMRALLPDNILKIKCVIIEIQSKGNLKGEIIK